MTGLAPRQLAFQAALVSGEAPIPDGILGNEREPASRMFGIYRHAYWARAVESLGTDFPGLKALLGEKDFAALAREYMGAHPSVHRSIRWIGSGLTEFAASNAPYGSDPWIADMARLDWALAHAFDAKDEEPARLADLTDVPPEFWASLRIDFHPSVSLFEVSTPVTEARAMLLGDPPGSIDRSLRRAVSVITWRFGLDLKYRELPEDEASAQRLMAKGGTFADMCDLLAAPEAQAPARRAGEILRGWLEWGAIGRVWHDALASA